jgi:hypothetical protein
MARAAKQQIAARIVLVDPPKGVVFALQRGKNERASAATASGPSLAFAFTFQVSQGEDGLPRFSGEFVQGPARGKFVYVTSGTSAGQPGSPWTRRAKVGLQSLDWPTIERAVSAANAVVQARIAGRHKDGGPACATVPLLDGGWTVVGA